MGAWLIRPVQMFDRRLAGLRQSTFGPPIAMHVGLHVSIQGGREFVVEQLFGTPWNAFVDGLNWTPLDVFRARNRGGWDVTVPATAFRKIDDRTVKEAIDFLNSIQTRPYFSEDCPTFVERAFGRRRLFADSPTARWIGLGLRVGDPALPLLRPDIRLDRRAERLLRAPLLRTLPDPDNSWNSPHARFLFHRMIFMGGFLLTGLVFGFLRSRGAPLRESRCADTWYSTWCSSLSEGTVRGWDQATLSAIREWLLSRTMESDQESTNNHQTTNQDGMAQANEAKIWCKLTLALHHCEPKGRAWGCHDRPNQRNERQNKSADMFELQKSDRPSNGNE
jgi:hypothetical protein